MRTILALFLLASTSVNNSPAADDRGASNSKPALSVMREIVAAHSRSGPKELLPRPYSEQNPLSRYETWLPHTTQPPIDLAEKALLKAYLNHPKNLVLARLLAAHHLNQARAGEQANGPKGKVLWHRIIAQYFLNRARDLGAAGDAIEPSIARNQRDLDAVFNQPGAITLDENRSAHLYFRETFHFKEANRYLATDKLLDEFVNDPNNVYTAFANNAINLWIGSEADYDDPTVLYNYAVGSYLSLHTMKLAHALEDAWNADPTHNTRFRMATILGGFSLLQRRWLAKLHEDQPAIDLIDDEHRAWRIIHPPFHAFTLGLPFFEEPQHFQEGKAAFEGALANCPALGVRTCSDFPRFPYNFLATILGYTDFVLKNGQPEVAAQVLSLRMRPDLAATYAYWDLGRAAYEHRENNLAEISVLYQNADPAAGPLNYFMKKRKWGMNTAVCQVCHQTQSQLFTPAQMDAIQLPPESEASVRNWPDITTTWYGAVRAQ